jgi:hypothetical protein
VVPVDLFDGSNQNLDLSSLIFFYLRDKKKIMEKYGSNYFFRAELQDTLLKLQYQFFVSACNKSSTHASATSARTLHKTKSSNFNATQFATSAQFSSLVPFSAEEMIIVKKILSRRNNLSLSYAPLAESCWLIIQ